jgi:pimeloyl-ACP methyl ester carboxylesterase
MSKTLKTQNNTSICVHNDLVAGATQTILVLHGYFGHAQTKNNQAAAAHFNTLGFHVVRPDFYGRGQSEGAFGDLTIARGVETAILCLNDIKKNHLDHKIMVTGGSFGGLVAMHLAYAYPNDIAALILRAPVSDWHDLWHREVPSEKMIAWQRDGYFADIMPNGREVTFGEELFSEMHACKAVYDDIAPAIHMPTLIVHGDHDEMVPVSHTEKLHRAMPQSELVILNGADHAFSREDDVLHYQDAITAFLNKQKRR